MAIYFFFFFVDFVINQQISSLKQDCLDVNWLQFNFHKFSGDKEDSIRDALMETMTPPFGSGDRLVILENTTICQQCSEELLSELGLDYLVKQSPVRIKCALLSLKSLKLGLYSYLASKIEDSSSVDNLKEEASKLY